MWDVQNGQCVRIFKDHRAPVTALAASMDGRLAASAGADKVIRLWDLGSGNLIKRMYGHEACVYSLSFSAEGTILCSGGADNVVHVWDVTREQTDEEKAQAAAALASQSRIFGRSTASKQAQKTSAAADGSHSAGGANQDRTAENKPFVR
jgi:WD40 repeat protein